MSHARLIERCVLVLVGVVALAVASPRASYGQVQSLPPSPTDTSPNPPIEPIPSEAEKAAKMEQMLAWLDGTLGPQLGMENPRQEWTARKASLDPYGIWTFRLDQMSQGIPVLDGHLVIHLQDVGGGDPEWHGQYMNNPHVDTRPKISRRRAIRLVARMVRKEVRKQGSRPLLGRRPGRRWRLSHSGATGEAVLEIHPGGGPGKRKLTYHVVVTDTSGLEPIQMHAWVGAQADNAGQVLRAYNNIQPVSGTGQTLYQGQVSSSPLFNVAYYSRLGKYVLNDNSLRIGVFDMFGSTGSTYYAGSPSTAFGTGFLSDRNTTNADTLLATVQTMSFFYFKLGRRYVDDNGGPKVYPSVDGLGPLLSARNHYGVAYNNAFWDGQEVNIGDGDGSVLQSLATLDVLGHEWTHGVTQFTAGLQYCGESGAANESFSDIFGAMTERYWKGESSNTWKIGEECFTPGIPGDALRYMDRPTNDGISPDYYSERSCAGCVSCGDLACASCPDNGGVHSNSGIQNNAFYLLATGDCHSFSGCMPYGIGADAATTIFYRALRDYLGPTDGFVAARRGTQYYAGVIYGVGSAQYNATVAAWDLVGVPR